VRDNPVRLVKIVGLISLLTATSFGQKGGQAGNQIGQPGAQGVQGAQGTGAGSPGLQGLSYSPNEWSSTLPSVMSPVWTFKQGRTVVCYRLAKGNSATQPFVLEPVLPAEIQSTGLYRPCDNKFDFDDDPEGDRRCAHLKRPSKATGDDWPVEDHWSPCSSLENERDPILANQILVVGIDISDLGSMGLNIDQLKLLNINVTNQQGSAINPTPLRATFPATSVAGGGGGLAGSGGGPKGAESKEEDKWDYTGTVPPNGARPQHWTEGHEYHDGDSVSDANGVNFYVYRNRHKGKRNGLLHPSGTRPTDPFTSVPVSDWTLDGDVVWQEIGRRQDTTGAAYWQEDKHYDKGAVVCVGRRVNFEAYDAQPDPIGVILLQYSAEERSRYGNRLYQAAQTYGSHITLIHTDSGLPNKSCADTQKNIDEGLMSIRSFGNSVDYHLQYYLAVRGGTSSGPPPDPLSLSFVQRTIYLKWPYELPGDVTPSLNVNLVYSPPVPGAIWRGSTFYPAGSVVVPRQSNGHYYTALTGGLSALTDEPTLLGESPPKVPDGTLLWLDSGTSPPTVPSAPGAGSAQALGGGQGTGQGGGQGGGQNAGGSSAGKAQLWFPNTHYLLGDVILNPDSGHYYTVVKSVEGFSGSKPPGTGTNGSTAKNPFTQSTSPAQTLTDGEVQWVLRGSTSDTSKCDDWKLLHLYFRTDCMLAANHSYYNMAASTKTKGISSEKNPFPTKPAQGKVLSDGDIDWLYAPGGSTKQAWQSGHHYSTTDSVSDPNYTSNVYVAQAINNGNSGSIDPSFLGGFGRPATVSDGDLLWADLGEQEGGSQEPDWKPNHSYQLGKTVKGPENHNYRVVQFTAGISGTDPSVFKIAQFQTVIDPKTLIEDHPPTAKNTQETGLEWLDLGDARPLNVPPIQCQSNICECKPGADQPSNATPAQWKPNTCYCQNSLIFQIGVGNGRYYQAQKCGESGDFSPFVDLNAPDSVTWEDSGTTAPASVAGGPPADQNVSLVNLALPQSHSLSYFNISAGFVVGFKRPPVFGFVPASGYKGTLPAGYVAASGTVSITSTSTAYAADLATGCTITVPFTTPPPSPAPNPNLAYTCPEQTTTGPIPADPVLVLTGYVVPVDAEIPMRWKGRNMWRDLVPAPSFGISLANPTTNFYLGASNEALVRNFEAFYGVAFHNTSLSLAPGSTQPLWGGAGAAPTPLTVSGFQKGPFIGVTFNLSGFVQSLFGGGGGAAK